MIFMCYKKCQTAILDRDNGIRQQPPSQFQKQAYSVPGCFLIIKKKHFELCTCIWKGQLKPRVFLELPLFVSDVRSLREVDLSSPTGAKMEPYMYVSPSTRQQSDITQFYTVRKQ